MADKITGDEAINRRAFLRQGGAVGVGLGIALDASTTATASASGMPDRQSPSAADVVPVPPAAIADLRGSLVERSYSPLETRPTRRWDCP